MSVRKTIAKCKILITQEYVDWYTTHEQSTSYVGVGDIYKVVDILIDKTSPGYIHVDCKNLWLGLVPLEIFSRMNLAYVETLKKEEQL